MRIPLRHICSCASAGAALILVSGLLPGQQGSAGKTSAEAYKNIQILKDVPSTQFIPAMRYVATALGVECEFCHQGNRSLDTPNKLVARKMMTMMLDINKQNFNGRTVVNCYTCHKGNHVPISEPVPTGQYSVAGPTAFYNPAAIATAGLDDVMAEAYREENAKEKAAATARTPSAEQILAKYVAALGGEEALKKITTRVITSTTELSPNVRGTGPTVYVQQVQYAKAPNLYATTLQRFNGAATARGFDGTRAWTQGANGAVTELAGTDASRARRDADFYASLNWKQQYTNVAVRGIEKIGDRDVFMLVGEPSGDNPERLYFDTQSGLLVRKVIFNTTPLGGYVIQTDYSDYRDVGGVKTPFLIKTLSVSPADTSVIHVEKVENNAVIDAAKLARPSPRAQ